jgi:hypothetical protein
MSLSCMLAVPHWDEMIEIAYSMSLIQVLMLFTDASDMRWYMYVTYMIGMIDLFHSMIASISCTIDLCDMSLSSRHLCSPVVIMYVLCV